MSERIEHDSMGEVRVPADALWGAQTARAVENFPISGLTMPPPIVHALALIKAAAARVNAELGALDADRAARDRGGGAGGRRRPARRPVPDRRLPDRLGHLDQHERQRGGRPAGAPAVRPRHPPQRPRQRRPVLQRHVPHRDPAGRRRPPWRRSWRRPWRTWRRRCARKEAEFASVVKAGRTHLMDAVPVTLGQEFSGYARQVELGRARVLQAAEGAAELPLGGTAAGTGLNAAPGFAAAVTAALAEETGIPLREADNHFEAQATQDAAGGAQRRRQGGRGQPDQDLQRPALDELGPAGRARRDPPARPAARVEHHAGQGQPGRPRGHADGVRPGHRQRRDDHRWPGPAATSSSTSCCRSSAGACWSR